MIVVHFGTAQSAIISLCRAFVNIIRLLLHSLLHRSLGAIIWIMMEFRGLFSKPFVLFDIDATGLREHCDPLIEWLVCNDCTVVVAVADTEVSNYRKAGVPQGAWCISKGQFNSFARKPAVCISFHPENGSSIAKKLAHTPTQRVVMQHGLSDKAAFGEIGKINPLADFDALFLAGPIFLEGSLKTYRYRYPETYERLTFFEIGLPKTDVLFHGKYDRRMVLSELGLDLEKPTVCYAPTWEKWASLEKYGIAILDALSELPVNVIVKLHHASLRHANDDWVLNDGHGGKDWKQLIDDLTKTRKNIKLAFGQDAAPYLVASDLLVSDASGVAYEYVLLDRPVIFFDVPELFDHYGTEGIHYWGRECGDIVHNISELKQQVLLNIECPNYKWQERRKWIDNICYTRGDATIRAGMSVLKLAASSKRIGV